MSSLSDLPVPALVAIALVVAVQLVLQVMALISLAKLPPARVSLGGRKWLWALLIIVGELAGPIAYFVGGRLPAVVDDPGAGRAGPNRGAQLVETLYGPAHLPGGNADGVGHPGDRRFLPRQSGDRR